MKSLHKIPVRRIAVDQKGDSITGQFNIRQLQPLLNGGDLRQDLHKHDFYFVLAVRSGKGIHEIDFVKYSITNNSIFILRPGQVHRLELKANTKGFLMEFDLSFYQPKKNIGEQRWRKASAKNYCKFENSRFTKLNSILSDIFNEYARKAEGFNEAIRANLDLFFIEYVRQGTTPATYVKPETLYTQERFEELSRLLEENIGSMKNVSEYANMMNMSPYQLNAITKLSIGKTVSELITGQVVLEAKRHLLATSSQVKEVADQLGYEDVSYFIRFFRKHTGYSPETFRKHFK